MPPAPPEQPVDASGNCNGRQRRDFTGLTSRDNFGDRYAFADDHGSSRSHRLDGGNAEVLGGGRQYEGRAVVQKPMLARAFHKTDPPDATVQCKP